MEQQMTQTMDMRQEDKFEDLLNSFMTYLSENYDHKDLLRDIIEPIFKGESTPAEIVEEAVDMIEDSGELDDVDSALHDDARQFKLLMERLIERKK